jgi:hypothetical protein
MAELLKEEISKEQQLDIYDPFTGNALYIHQYDTGAQLWIYASGKAMNILSKFNLLTIIRIRILWQWSV